MVIFFRTRSEARSKLTQHKMVDNGPDAPKGKRYARSIDKDAVAASKLIARGHDAWNKYAIAA